MQEVCSDAKDVGVSAVVGAGKIVFGGGKGDISGGFGRRGGANLRGRSGTGRDNVQE